MRNGTLMSENNAMPKYATPEIAESWRRHYERLDQERRRHRPKRWPQQAEIFQTLHRHKEGLLRQDLERVFPRQTLNRNLVVTKSRNPILIKEGFVERISEPSTSSQRGRPQIRYKANPDAELYMTYTAKKVCVCDWRGPKRWWLAHNAWACKICGQANDCGGPRQIPFYGYWVSRGKPQHTTIVKEDRSLENVEKKPPPFIRCWKEEAKRYDKFIKNLKRDDERTKWKEKHPEEFEKFLQQGKEQRLALLREMDIASLRRNCRSKESQKSIKGYVNIF